MFSFVSFRKIGIGMGTIIALVAAVGIFTMVSAPGDHIEERGEDISFKEPAIPPENAQILTGIWEAQYHLILDPQTQEPTSGYRLPQGENVTIGFSESGICFSVVRTADGPFFCSAYEPYRLEQGNIILLSQSPSAPQLRLALRGDSLEGYLTAEGTGMRFTRLSGEPPVGTDELGTEGLSPETIDELFDKTELVGVWKGTQQLTFDTYTNRATSSKPFGPEESPPYLSFREDAFCYDIVEREEEFFCLGKYKPYRTRVLDLTNSTIEAVFVEFQFDGKPGEQPFLFNIEWRNGKIEMASHDLSLKFVLERLSTNPLAEAVSTEDGGKPLLLYCGDGVCSYNENNFVCPADCGP